MIPSKVALQLVCVMMFVLPGMAFAGGTSSHTPIVIQSDADFSSCNCVTEGDGSTANPFVIGPWVINKVVTGAGISIDGAILTKSFVIWNATIAGNGSSSAMGILLRTINPAG